MMAAVVPIVMHGVGAVRRFVLAIAHDDEVGGQQAVVGRDERQNVLDQLTGSQVDEEVLGLETDRQAAVVSSASVPPALGVFMQSHISHCLNSIISFSESVERQ
jgi:hypothetical protein